MDREITNTIKRFLKDQRENSNIICTREDLAFHIGVSHATLYDRLKTDCWQEYERVALSELIPINHFDSNQIVTKMVLKFLDAQMVKKKELVMTRDRFAQEIGIPVSTLYNRFNRGGWTEQEILKIQQVCLSGGRG